MYLYVYTVPVFWPPNILFACFDSLHPIKASTILQLCRDGSSWVEPVLKAIINVSCLRTQCSDASEARICGHSVSSQAP